METLNTSTTSRQCLNCGRLFKGRTDKKFCDGSCRSTYNNMHVVKFNSVKHINSILKRNRVILMQVMADEKTVTIDKQELVKKDFNFNYFTHMVKDRQSILYHCYDYIIRINRNNCTIIKE